jgi:hypothetical protein
MSEQPGLARPRRVTVAGVMAAAACVLLVLSLFDAMADVRSAETRDAIDAFLRKPPGDGLTVGVERVVELLRGVVLFSGALAAAGSVLAVYTLRRHRGARIGLTIIAVLLLFSATFVTGILPVVVAVAVTMLWSREARDWFDGRAARPAGVAPDGGSEASRPSLAAWGVGPSDRAPQPPPASQPFGTSAADRPPATWGALTDQAAAQVGRPAAVTAAAWLTWVFAALTMFFSGLIVLVILAARTQLLEALQRDPTIGELNLSSRQILGGLWVFSAVTIVWSLAAIALAILAFRRVNAGRIGLMVSAAASGVVSVFAVPVGWPISIAAFTALALLVGSSASRWYGHQDGPGRQQPPPPPAGRPPVQRPEQRPPGQQPPGQQRPKPPVW